MTTVPTTGEKQMKHGRNQPQQPQDTFYMNHCRNCFLFSLLNYIPQKKIYICKYKCIQ